MASVGLDTNIVIRYLTQDDRKQSQQATKIIESLTDAEPGFISLVTLAEVSWVLRSAYAVGNADLANVIEKLLDSRELVIQDADIARRALAALQAGHGFADALIAEAGIAAGCTETLTFDKSAAKLAGMRLVAARS